MLSYILSIKLWQDNMDLINWAEWFDPTLFWQTLVQDQALGKTSEWNIDD